MASIILFNDEFLFVHNPKTADTSLLHHFERVLRGPVHVAGVRELGTHHPHLSLALGYACAKTGNRPQDFKRILSVLRNPFDRRVSMYTYFRDHLFGAPAAAENLNDPEMEEVVRRAASLSFRDYLTWLMEDRGTCDVWGSHHY